MVVREAKEENMSRTNSRPNQKPGRSKRPRRLPRPKGSFWKHKTAEQFAAEQRIGPIKHLEDI
jgi:hypothetical protein